MNNKVVTIQNFIEEQLKFIQEQTKFADGSFAEQQLSHNLSYNIERFLYDETLSAEALQSIIGLDVSSRLLRKSSDNKAHMEGLLKLEISLTDLYPNLIKRHNRFLYSMIQNVTSDGVMYDEFISMLKKARLPVPVPEAPRVNGLSPLLGQMRAANP